MSIQILAQPYNETGLDTHGTNTDYFLLEQEANGQVEKIDLQTGIGTNLGPNPGSTWVADGIGDFTNNGIGSDLLFQNSSTGEIDMWEMDHNGNLIGGGEIAIPERVGSRRP